MDDMHPFERQVAAEVVREMRPSRPVNAVAVIAAVDGARSPRWRFQSMFGATKYVIAGAIVALFGGFLLAGMLTQPEDTSPIVGATPTSETGTSQPIELPTDLEGMESGTLTTPLGPARWVHLSGDETMLPPTLFGLLSTPDGYVVPELGGRDAKLWRSSDLIGWTSESLGIRARYAGLSRAGDAYWLNVYEPNSLWRSTDTVSWEQVSFDELIPPGPDGYAWSVWPEPPLTHGDVSIVPFRWVTDSWIVARGLPAADDARFATLVETAPGVFDIDDWGVGGENRGTFATVRFEETAVGLRVIDHEDGTELKVLEGVSMEFIKLLAFQVESQFDEIAWQQVPGLAILDGTTLVEVEPPLEVEEPEQQAFTVDDDGFVSYTLGLDGLVHVHRSPDGREWRETDLIGDDTDEPNGIEDVYAETGSVRLGTSVGGWRSTDGLAWERHAPERLRTEHDLFPMGMGWIFVPFDTNPVTGVQDVGPGNIIPRIWFQPAEGEPAPIDITEMALPMSDCGGVTGPLSPNTIASHFDEDCTGVREAWVITFDDLPA